MRPRTVRPCPIAANPSRGADPGRPSRSSPWTLRKVPGSDRSDRRARSRPRRGAYRRGGSESDAARTRRRPSAARGSRRRRRRRPRKTRREGRAVPIDAKLLHEEKVEEVESKKDGATSKHDGAASNAVRSPVRSRGSLPRAFAPSRVFAPSVRDASRVSPGRRVRRILRARLRRGARRVLALETTRGMVRRGTRRAGFSANAAGF